MNAKPEYETVALLKSRMDGKVFAPDYPLEWSEKCYTELYPKENLVYLTPDCREELKVYDPDAIYIIGAIVDLSANKPLTMAKSKRQKIRFAKLPLDK